MFPDHLAEQLAVGRFIAMPLDRSALAATIHPVFALVPIDMPTGFARRRRAARAMAAGTSMHGVAADLTIAGIARILLGADINAAARPAMEDMSNATLLDLVLSMLLVWMGHLLVSSGAPPDRPPSSITHRPPARYCAGSVR
jgi:hypothetical protein